MRERGAMVLPSALAARRSIITAELSSGGP
jgi:hypothetical protein